LPGLAVFFVLVVLFLLMLSIRIVQEYDRGVLFRAAGFV